MLVLHRRVLQALDDTNKKGFRLGCFQITKKTAGILIVVFRLLIFVLVAAALVISVELPCL